MAAQKLDLNKATPDQLDSLDGIGPSLANRLVSYRKQHGKFKSFDDLKNIPGFGKTVVSAFKSRTVIR